MRDRLEAVCSSAQRQIDALMGQLGDLAEMALSDPNNQELRQRIQNVLGDAQAISAKLVAAVGQDLLIESNRVLGAQLAGTSALHCKPLQRSSLVWLLSSSTLIEL